jgi:hypothetical protein
VRGGVQIGPARKTLSGCLRPVGSKPMRLLANCALLLSLTVTWTRAQYEFATNAGSLTITRYSGAGGVISVPEQVDGYPVTAIGNSAFGFATNLASVTVPPSVTSIGEFAFIACSFLNEVKLNGAITDFGASAFANCMNLEQVTLAKGTTAIAVSGFMNCSALKSITIPGSVVEIGAFSFYGCSNLAQVTLQSGIRSIRANAFAFCVSLPGIEFPASLTSIGERAFVLCTNLANVLIPASVTNLGVLPFSGCSKLTEINVDLGNAFYSSRQGILFNKAQTTLLEYPNGVVGSYVIPGSVTSIGESAFDESTNLTSCAIAGSVTSIGDRAFEGCSKLTVLNLPAGLVDLGEAPFGSCSSLSAIQVDSANPVFSSVNGVLFDKKRGALIACPGAFGGSYEIPSEVTKLADEAFYGCAALRSLVIPGSIKEFGDLAFLDCAGLTNAVLGEGLKEISYGAFTSCASLTTVSLPETLETIGGFAFSSCSNLARLTIPASVTHLDAAVFDGCPNLKSVYFEGKAPSLGFVDPFDDTNGAVYYLAGSSGWSSTFGGRPARLWNPQIRAVGLELGAPRRSVSFEISGAPDLVVRIESAATLSSTSWLSFATVTLTNGAAVLSEAIEANGRSRFYRAMIPK